MSTTQYSAWNYDSAKLVRYAFGLSEYELVKMVAQGKVQMYRRIKRPLVILDSLGEAMYSDREDRMVMKKWNYDYESVEEKYEKAVKPLHGFPRCFFKADAPIGHYRVFYKKKMLHVLVYVMEDFVRCVCYNRANHKDLETIYSAFLDGRIDWED